MDNAIRRACEQCLGTDTQYECERGQCYAEECQRYEEARRQAERDWNEQRDFTEDQSHGG